MTQLAYHLNPGTETVERVTRLREAAGIKRSELARRAGVSKTWVYSLEAPRMRSPSERLLERLASALGVAPGYIIDGVEQSGQPYDPEAMASELVKVAGELYPDADAWTMRRAFELGAAGIHERSRARPGGG